jgi:hypothetical protein
MDVYEVVDQVATLLRQRDGLRQQSCSMTCTACPN